MIPYAYLHHGIFIENWVDHAYLYPACIAFGALLVKSGHHLYQFRSLVDLSDSLVWEFSIHHRAAFQIT